MEYSYKDFCDCLRDARESGMEFARGQIRLTRSYRLGYAILHPINGLKRVLKISK